MTAELNCMMCGHGKRDRLIPNLNIRLKLWRFREITYLQVFSPAHANKKAGLVDLFPQARRQRFQICLVIRWC